MSKKIRHLRAVISVIICSAMILSMSCDVASAASSPAIIKAGETAMVKAGESVMVTAGEAAAETALTPALALEKENELDQRLEEAVQDAFSDTVSDENQNERKWEVITIHTDDDLKELAKNCSLDTWSEYKYVRLEEDILLINSDFTTIPVFNGIFDGNGHRITEYSYSGDGYVTGLFRYIGVHGVVKDLELFAHINAKNDRQVTGGLCGVNYGVIRNCSFEGKIKGKTSTGAFAAINEVTGMISFCKNKGTVMGYYYTGGIAGKNYGTISDSVNEGDLNDTEEWVNEEDEMDTGSKILESIRSGNTEENPLASTGTDTGGIAGYSKGSII